MAQVLVWLLAQQGIDASPIETPVSLIATAVLGVVGGYLVRPPNKGRHTQ